jgi:hydroxymethylpyrimidine pyrophosphatase-like HAD family hydrolase
MVSEAIQAFCAEEYPNDCRTEIFYNTDGALHSLAICAPQADKKTALGVILAHLGISPQQAIAIGDNMNDLPMLSFVGFSVAMGNAIPELKQCASVIAPDNDHEGVAWALETYVLPDDPMTEFAV